MSEQRDERDRQEPVPDLDEAIAVYSADGQADDESANDAAAERSRNPDRPRDPGHTGMPHGPDSR